METDPVKALRILRELSLIALCVSVSLAALQAYRVLRQESVSQVSGAKVNAAVDGLTKLEGGGTDAVKVIKDAAQKEAQFYDPTRPGTTANYFQRSAHELHDFIGDTRINLNGGLSPITHKVVAGTLPAATLALSGVASLTKHSSDAMDATASAIKALSDGMTPGMQDFDFGMKAFATQTPLILTDTATSAHNTAIITTNGAAISADGVKVADHYEKVLLAPASKLRAAAMFTASLLQHLFSL